MVQKIALGELLPLPALFPFRESCSPGKELLLKELYPPIPVWNRGKEEGKRIIWGKRLIEQLEGLNKAEAFVRTFGPDELSLSEALILWTELEQKQERWNQSRVEEFNLLPSLLQQLVMEEKVDLKTALRVKNLPLEPLEILTPLLGKLSYSERRIFLRLFFEIVQRDHRDAKESIDLATYLVHSSRPLEELQRIRYPELNRLEESYHAAVDSILKGTGIRVSPPPYFEGTQFKVEFSFEKSSQLRRKAGILQQLSEIIDPVVKQLTHDAP